MNGSLILLRAAVVLGLGYYGGVNWVAGSIAVTAAISLVVSLWFGLPSISATWADFIRPMWRTLVAAALMSAGILVLRVHMPVSSELRTATLQLVGAIALGGVLYMATLLSLWLAAGRPSGPEQQVVNTSLELLHRWMPPPFLRSARGGPQSSGRDGTSLDSDRR